MGVEFLIDYAIPVIVGICLCIGYIIKNVFKNKKLNQFIPLIMGVLGVGLNIWINGKFDAVILLGGLFSGLASTGLYEALKNLIFVKKDGE